MQQHSTCHAGDPAPIPIIRWMNRTVYVKRMCVALRKWRNLRNATNDSYQNKHFDKSRGKIRISGAQLKMISFIVFDNVFDHNGSADGTCPQIWSPCGPFEVLCCMKHFYCVECANMTTSRSILQYLHKKATTQKNKVLKIFVSMNSAWPISRKSKDAKIWFSRWFFPFSLFSRCQVL